MTILQILITAAVVAFVAAVLIDLAYGGKP